MKWYRTATETEAMPSDEVVKVLFNALQRIAEYEFRADRRNPRMVDIDEIGALIRIARTGLRQAEELRELERRKRRVD